MPLTAAGTSAAGAAASAAKGEDQLRIEMLGAGNEVGRSCCVLTYKGELVIRLAGSLKYRELTLGSLTLTPGKTVVCDAGVHPAYSGIAALPFIDELDWSTVDALLITQ